MIRARSVIKSWFFRGAKPLADQFHDWMDSYFHKTEDIPLICLYEYNAGLTYPAGVSVIYDGNVYQSVSQTTGTWIPGDWKLIGGATDVYYTNPDPTTAAVGGIPASSTFDHKSNYEMWTMLLYPYQNPGFAGFTAAGLPGAYEVGYMIPPATHLFTWSTSQPANVQVNSIGISGTGMTALTGLANDGNESVLFLNPIGLNTAGSLYWTITGTNTHGVPMPPASFGASWQWRMYWGTSTATPLDQAQIKALVGNALAGTYAGTRSFAAADYQYKYVAYPTAFGLATKFTDASTLLSVPFEAAYAVSVTNAYSQTTNYYVQRSTNMLGGAMNIIIGN